MKTKTIELTNHEAGTLSDSTLDLINQYEKALKNVDGPQCEDFTEGAKNTLRTFFKGQLETFRAIRKKLN